jgi:hypothetical protein
VSSYSTEEALHRSHRSATDPDGSPCPSLEDCPAERYLPSRMAHAPQGFLWSTTTSVCRVSLLLVTITGTSGSRISLEPVNSRLDSFRIHRWLAMMAAGT